MQRLPRPASVALIDTTPTAHPLWCRGNNTPATPCQRGTDRGPTLLRTLSGVEELPRPQRLASVARIQTPPLRIFWCRTNVTPATPCERGTDMDPSSCTPLLASWKCSAYNALRAWHGSRPRPPPHWCRGKATPAMPCKHGTGRGTSSCAPPLVSRNCHACHALRAWHG